jgi:CDP-glucose 4,6-dehydratase
MFGGQFAGKKVWLSGHTGFKGSWLATWLLRLGAQVHGFALEPPTVPSAFEQLGLALHLEHQVADIRDLELVRQSIRRAKPDFIFHLAAQPLVRLSYSEPVATYETNVMGTAHVLEALREVTHPCVAIFVTTDKCYHNLEKNHAYREDDPLGGRDPYSSSKAAAELVIEAYRSSFFGPGSPGAVKIASARAGNVIGGGDWALDRIVPDAIRALEAGNPIAVRNKDATRPWQHVLEPLSGYLWLAAVLAKPELRTSGSDAELPTAFNFGPRQEANRNVKDLVEEVLKHWPGSWVDRHQPGAPHEARLLNLDTSKAGRLLGWEPVWSFERSIAATVEWYRKSATRAIAEELTAHQIQDYSARAGQVSMAWASDHA